MSNSITRYYWPDFAKPLTKVFRKNSNYTTWDLFAYFCCIISFHDSPENGCLIVLKEIVIC